MSHFLDWFERSLYFFLVKVQVLKMFLQQWFVLHPFLQELLAKLCGFLPLHQPPRRRLRAVQVLPKELQQHLPWAMDRAVGRAEGKGSLPRQIVNQQKKKKNILKIVTFCSQSVRMWFKRVKTKNQQFHQSVFQLRNQPTLTSFNVDSSR